MTGREGSGTAAPTAAGPADDRGPETGFAARALTDPAFLARFRAVYEGEDDPVDALWWLDRPEEPGPSGAAAPGAVARSARRALYGPGTDAAAMQEYECAAARAERSRAAAVAALGRLPVRGATAPVATPEGASGPPPSVLPRSALRPVVAAAAAVAVVAAAAGFGVGRMLPAAAPVTPALTEQFQQTVTGQDAATVFDRAPEAADLLGGALEPLDTVNLRRLVTIGSVRFLAARTVGDDAALCLIAADGTRRTAARCATLRGFEHDGITLTTADGLPNGFARVRWQPDGRLVWWSPVD